MHLLVIRAVAKEEVDEDEGILAVNWREGRIGFEEVVHDEIVENRLIIRIKQSQNEGEAGFLFGWD